MPQQKSVKSDADQDVGANGAPEAAARSYWDAFQYSVASLLDRATESWRTSWLFRCVACLLSTALLLIFVRFIGSTILPERERLWAANNLDATLLTALSAIILLGLLVVLSVVLFPRSERLKDLRSDSFKWIGAAIVAVTLFAGYATFRNQGRLASEAAMSAGGYHLYSLEMSRPEIRCLYFNYAHHDPRGCLERIAKDPELWSFALFYVEESWFQLEQAVTERDEWGSTYAEMIRYWAQDVSRDFTGMFSYYLISSERSLDSALLTMRGADVNIRGVCTRFRIVWRSLHNRGVQPPRVSGAARQCGSFHPIDPTILAAGVLVIEEDR